VGAVKRIRQGLPSYDRAKDGSYEGHARSNCPGHPVADSLVFLLDWGVVKFRSFFCW